MCIGVSIVLNPYLRSLDESFQGMRDDDFVGPGLLANKQRFLAMLLEHSQALGDRDKVVGEAAKHRVQNLDGGRVRDSAVRVQREIFVDRPSHLHQRHVLVRQS